MLARNSWIPDISVKANRGRSRAVKDGLAGTTLYVAPAPVYRRLVKREKRSALVADVVAILKCGSLSAFQYESATRTALRLRFLGQGHPWAISDMEAAALIEEAFSAMGVERPDWFDGQPNATTGPDYCQTCFGPLEDAEKADHRRFCGEDCARTMRFRGFDRFVAVHHSMVAHATYVTKLAEIPERPCIVCSTPFRSLEVTTTTCSPECAGIAKRSVPERACGHCSKRFRPHTVTRGGQFCSKSCADGARRLRPKTCLSCLVDFIPARREQSYCSSVCFTTKPGLSAKPCEWCGEDFSPRKHTAARFCSRTCKDRARNRERAGKFAATRCE